MKMTTAAAIAPNSGRVRIREASERCGLVSVVSGGLVVTGVLMVAPEEDEGDRPRGSSALLPREARSAGVLLRVRQDLVDVGLVHDRRTGQHGLAAAEVVAVGQVQPQRLDGHVALHVGLLV